MSATSSATDSTPLASQYSPNNPISSNGNQIQHVTEKVDSVAMRVKIGGAVILLSGVACALAANWADLKGVTIIALSIFGGVLVFCGVFVTYNATWIVRKTGC